MRPRLAWLALLAGCAHHGDAGPPDSPGGDLVDASCGSQHIGLSYVAPNLLFVLDRSCSMRQVLAGTTTTKWQAAVDSVTHALSTYTTQVRWGATLFPDITGDSCTQDAIPIPVGDNNASAIASLLTGSLDPMNPLYPSNPCVTNIDTGLEQAATDPALADPTRASYLMLVTDGSQSKCNAGGGNAGSESAVQALLAQGVKTFVVGFGSDVNGSELGKLAMLGGEAVPGSPAYYQADTAADLDQAFQTIGSVIASCSYHLAQTPPDLSQTYVYFDHVLVPHDPNNGWDYDPATQTLTLYGMACDELRAHQVTAVDVVYGCPLL